MRKTTYENRKAALEHDRVFSFEQIEDVLELINSGKYPDGNFGDNECQLYEFLKYNFNSNLESNLHDYPEYILKMLRQRFGYESDDTSNDCEFIHMSPQKVFDEICTWNGFIQWGPSIRNWIKDIYQIDI